MNHFLEMRIERELKLDQIESLKDAIFETIMKHSQENELDIDSHMIDLIVLDASDVK